jgi:hypothetical protein
MEQGISMPTAIAIFGFAFGCWAWVVGWGVAVIRRELDDLKNKVHHASVESTKMMLDVEHRLTVVESDIKRCQIFARSE